MSPEVTQFLNEAASQGRIKAMLDSVVTCLGKGPKRTAFERRCLWQSIADEAAKCRDEIANGVKPRAPKAAKTPSAQATIKVVEGA